MATLAALCRPAPPPLVPLEQTTHGPRQVAEADLAHHAAAAERAASLTPGRDAPDPLATPRPPFVPHDPAAVHVGSAPCAGCHIEASQQWARSAHAHALSTLERARASHDPACLRCHVTGMGKPSGHPAPGLDAVGCEACHGPGSAHIVAPSDPYGQLPADDAACVACHTVDTAPSFRFLDAWPAVAHGK